MWCSVNRIDIESIGAFHEEVALENVPDWFQQLKWPKMANVADPANDFEIAPDLLPAPLLRPRGATLPQLHWALPRHISRHDISLVAVGCLHSDMVQPCMLKSVSPVIFLTFSSHQK